MPKTSKKTLQNTNPQTTKKFAPKPKSAPKTTTAKPKKKKKELTAAEKKAIEDRRCLVLDLARSGASIRQIAEQLEIKGIQGCSKSTVADDLQHALTEAAALRQQKTELLVEQELIKIDDWELTTYAKFKKELNVFNFAALGNLLLKFQERRDRFLAISKTQTSQNAAANAIAQSVVEFIRPNPQNEHSDS